MTVFVIQNQHQMGAAGALVPKFDLSPAEKYGELSFLLSPTARPFSSEHVIGQLRDKLHSFCNDDYLLLVGNPCLIGFAVAIAADYNDGMVKILQWSGVEQRYIAIEADLKFFVEGK